MSQIRHFLAVAEAGSVGRAAQSIAVSQPALSKSIRRLEGELQVRLFDRSPLGSPLTRFGKEFLPYARVIALAARNAEASMRAMRSAGPQDLTIGASPSLARSALPNASAAIVDDNPGLRVHVITGMVDELFRKVSSGAIDFAVTAMPEDLPLDLGHEILAHTTLRVVARDAHPLMRSDRVDLVDLLGFPWILPSGGASGRQALARCFSMVGLPPPTPTIEGDSITYIASFLHDNDYLSFLPMSLLAPHDGFEAIRALPIHDPQWVRPIAAIYRKGTELSPSSRKLVMRIQAEVEALERAQFDQESDSRRAPS